jgi:predicted metalloprotease with PDZ domain
MALHPRGRAILSTDSPAHTRDLWWSEGLTIYYATLLQHRAGFPEEGRGHAAGLSNLLNRYYNNPGNMRISPESGSWSSIDPPAQLGFSSDYYLQGQIIGEMLDLIIRDSTRGHRGIDDVMRAMYTRFANKRGFTGPEIESTTERVCACNLTKFFDDHVRNAREFDFNRHLAPLGYRLAIDTILAADSVGRALPDLRLYTTNSDDTSRTYVRIMTPESVWAKSGLRTGMELLSFNGTRIGNFQSFRTQLRSLKIGDVVNVDVQINGRRRTYQVTIPQYTRVRVQLVDVAPLTAAQQRRRAPTREERPTFGIENPPFRISFADPKQP